MNASSTRLLAPLALWLCQPLAAQPVDNGGFEQQADDWAGARNYMVFLHVGGSFAGKASGPPAFHRAVGEWAKAWAEHNREIGLEPKQVSVLIVDEPGGGKSDERILPWAKAIRAGDSWTNGELGGLKPSQPVQPSLRTDSFTSSRYPAHP